MHHVLSDDMVAHTPPTLPQPPPSKQPDTASSSKHVGAERTIIVHRVHDPNMAMSPIDQLLNHARTIVPAVLNYIYFGAADMAVVYFGKAAHSHVKSGIAAADDMKIRMLRFLTSEIWPQLLRTDVPDESQAVGDADSPLLQTVPTAGDGGGDGATTVPPSSLHTQRRQWLQKSLENGMQVLVYLKPGAKGTKYLKLVLSNTPRRIHFDIVDSREERLRWDNRMLHIRMLDNLETQKAIDSYETYERYFREACECSARHCAELERPDQPLVSVVYHDASPHSCLVRSDGLLHQRSASPSAFVRATTPSAAMMQSVSFPDEPRPTMTPITARTPTCFNAERGRSYHWLDNLQKPESLTLDYKSYFTHPAYEIQARAVKFMCGFLNGIGQGKLVIGVHEMDRSSAVEQDDRSMASSTSEVPSADALLDASGNTIVTHNMLVEQLVVGVAITDAEISALQLDLSEQLQQCIPPIPPQAVQIDVVPVLFEQSVLDPGHVLLMYNDTGATGWKDMCRQKANFAIRKLRKRGYALCPFEFNCDGSIKGSDPRASLRELFPTVDACLPEGVTGWQLYAVAPIRGSHNKSASSSGGGRLGTAVDSDFADSIHKMIDISRNKGKHVVVKVPHLTLPQLRILEVSVNLSRCPQPLASYKGKFFNGWPSIPIWNPVTDTISRVDRNYHIFSQPAKSVDRELLLTSTSQWYRNSSIVSTIFYFSCGVAFSSAPDSRRLRQVHPSFNDAFEMNLGVPLVDMLHATPVGTPGFVIARETVSLLQTSLKVSRLATIPLLLVHVYETLGSLLSPFPYVATPVSMQALRVNPQLVPLYLLHDYDTMSLRPEVVLDVRDGCIKVLQWSNNGSGAAHLACVRGVGFAKLSRRTLEALARAAPHLTRLERTRSLRHIGKQPPPASEMGSWRQDTSDAADGTPTTGSTMASPQPSTDLPAALDGMHAPLGSVRCNELNVPLLRFSFLHGNHGKLFHGAPWTLVSLLKWLQAVAHDPRIRSFGHCDRSFGIYPDFTKEVCIAHLEDNEDDLGLDGGSDHTSPTSVYASSFDCTICRLMLEWNAENRGS